MIKFTGPGGKEIWVRPDAVELVLENPDNPDFTQVGSFSAHVSVRESVPDVLNKLHRRSTEWKG